LVSRKKKFGEGRKYSPYKRGGMCEELETQKPGGRTEKN